MTYLSVNKLKLTRGRKNGPKRQSFNFWIKLFENPGKFSETLSKDGKTGKIIFIPKDIG